MSEDRGAQVPHVYFNGRFLAQRQTGIQRYARETLLAMDELLSKSKERLSVRYVLLVPSNAAQIGLRTIEVRTVGILNGHLWEQITLPLVTRGELLWSFGPTGPLWMRKQAVTIHDASIRTVPEAFGWRFRALYNVAMPLLARRATKIMTVSEFSRHEVSDHFGADYRRIGVSGEGWEHALRVGADACILAKHGLERDKYVLAVSSMTRHKNFSVIERALPHLGALGVRVAVAGDVNEQVFSSLPRSSLRAVTRLGFVTDAELRALYENAGVFVYPSLYEGFGLPPLEAMACGCPVIASRSASIPEVCGPGARYFAPHDERELARLVCDVLGNANERREMAALGRAQLQLHGWQQSARSHLHAIEHALQCGSPADARPRAMARSEVELQRAHV